MPITITSRSRSPIKEGRDSALPSLSQVPSIRDRYQQFVKVVGREFRRNRRLHGGKIRCKQGCTDCCHQVFPITEVEAAEISRGITTLDPQLRARLVENAGAYLPRRAEIFNRHGYIRAWGHLPKPEMRLACPALINGECAIYEQRPIHCRKVGMPLHHPERSGRIFACELNFRPGESYQDAQLVPIQSAMAEDWVQLQVEFDKRGGKREQEPICVADALLKNYKARLPPEIEQADHSNVAASSRPK